jgi:hypothetical protein
MANVTYDKQATAVLVIDPYNDFLGPKRSVPDTAVP